MLQDEPDSPHIRLISGYLDSAVSWCSTVCGRPILPQTDTRYLLPGFRGEGRDEHLLHLGQSVNSRFYRSGGFFEGGGYGGFVGSYGKESPLILELRDLKSIESISYWSEDVERRDDPDGTITIPDLGTLKLYDSAPWEHEQHPPADGWPNILNSTSFKVVSISHIDDSIAKWTSIKEGCRQALWHLYQQMPRVELEATLKNILRPLRYE